MIANRKKKTLLFPRKNIISYFIRCVPFLNCDKRLKIGKISHGTPSHVRSIMYSKNARQYWLVTSLCPIHFNTYTTPFEIISLGKKKIYNILVHRVIYSTMNPSIVL